MIRVQKQTDYGVRVILCLAKREAGTRLSTSEIQKEMLIPAAFSARIVAELARGNFINTYPGRDGGVSLARPASGINLREVVERFEGRIFVSECLKSAGECPFGSGCPVRCRWARLQGMMLEELERTTFDELAREALSVGDLGLLKADQA